MTHGAFKCESKLDPPAALCECRLSRGCAGRNPVNRRCVLHNCKTVMLSRFVALSVPLANAKRIADVPSDRPLVRGQFREEAPRL